MAQFLQPIVLRGWVGYTLLGLTWDTMTDCTKRQVGLDSVCMSYTFTAHFFFKKKYSANFNLIHEGFMKHCSS
jgi:hypothetical protein